ncbi:MAG: type II toxin-antitoxin system PemK/MazF family toxin [Chloroflexota bacterium]|nr:type II toxin-antitoxin system PemK/MazF family toxin [Chloroflexota bacterium]
MIRRGEIYHVDFSPARGSEQTGRRPALVIQNDIGNQYAATTIVAAITSRQRRPYPFHVQVSARESGLLADSTVMLEQVLTISQERLQEKAGQLGPEKMSEVDLALHHSLGLTNCAVTYRF